MISNELVAKITGSDALLPASVNLAMLGRSADANTSAGAPPSLIWVTNSDDAAKLNVTSASGSWVMNASPMSVKASANDAAANTVTVPVDSAPSSSPHADTSASTTAAENKFRCVTR